MSQKIMTLGPASNSKELMQEMLKIATSFRLNIAHLSAKSLRDKLVEINDVFTDTAKTIPVTLDLQGAKVRIGQYRSVKSLPQIVTLVHSHCSEICNEIPISFESKIM